MFIEPIHEIKPLDFQWETEKVKSNSTTVFGDIFQSALSNVSENEKALEQAQYLMMSGQLEDAHTLPIASSMAQLSIDFLVQLRNKTLDAYNELMRINL